MEFGRFINQTIVNKNNEIGQVVSFEKERITVKFVDRKVIYNPQIAFSNHFLSFVDDDLNQLVEFEYIKKPQEEEKQQEMNHRFIVERHKKVRARYIELQKKAYILRKLFGPDYVYPPFEELKRVYKYVIPLEDEWIRNIFNSIGCGYRWYYYW